MLDAGNLEVASATSLALAEAGQDRLFEGTEQYAKDMVLWPTSLSNRAELVVRFSVIAINSALGVELYGHVNSTHIAGSQVVNGIGGSSDFTQNGLVSVIELLSTAKNGSISRIVPMVPHVDHIEYDFGVFITKHGVADSRNCSPRERAQVISADSSFHDELCTYLERADSDEGHVPMT